MRLNVNLADRSYPIIVSSDGLSGLGAALLSNLPGTQRVIVVSNETVWALFCDEIRNTLSDSGVEMSHILVPDGEGEKSVQRWQWLVNKMLGMGIDRQTPVVALGGGVVGDLAGFAAATVMRGVPLVQVPTTLLAMVDSSVGGKTAVNTAHGKNLVGAFYQPKLVFASLEALVHLPEVELKSGLGEVVKHGVLADPDLMTRCRTNAEAILERDPKILEDLVVRSIKVKSHIVALDERESGLRAVLNLGHTVGHAVEATLMGTENALPHGICVAMGLLAEVSWAHGRGACKLETVNACRDTISALGLPLFPPQLDIDAVLSAARFDKKALRGKLRTPIVEAIGQVSLTEIHLDECSELFHSLPGFRDA